MEAFARSDEGARVYNLHQNADVSIVESQTEMVPLQATFLMIANDEHGPDDPNESDVSNNPSVPNAPSPNF